ncbi:MAG: M20/M25/M40 family metallo-hydrolase [Candidatus Latescibacterota bacterium]|nr:MAG: M20/M25/M40 family metallo-hydrolase [Candidatus Latescibacterota bacterium]
MRKNDPRQNGLTLLVFVVGVLMLNPLTSGPTWSEKTPGSAKAENKLENRLRAHVDMLADSIGERNIWCPDALSAAATYIERFLVGRGYEVRSQTFETDRLPVRNLEVEIAGSTRAEEIVVVGAHYDSVVDSPGANDNASGVAGLLEIARRLAGTHPSRTLRLVAFVNEEPPFFQSAHMGSRRYAKRCRERGENIVAMLSLETIGYYSSEKGSQHYPFPFSFFYPNTADFIGVVGNLSSRSLVKQVESAFEKHSDFPCESASVPGWITGIGWSDHWAFWKEGYRAIMVTDTALFRYPYYHTRDDTPDKVDFASLARVVDGLTAVTAELTGIDPRIGDSVEGSLGSD